MSQRYRAGIAHERMAAGTCPECGKPPRAHALEATVMGMFASCNLLEHGVTDRIAQYQADLAEEASDGTP